MKLTLTNLHPSLRPPLREWRRRTLGLVRALREEPPRGCAPDVRELGVALLDDEHMATMNWRHLRHRGPTDILTFPYGLGRGEILISLDTAASQARAHRQTLEDEVTLYLAHGLLHLAGLDDHTAPQRRRMRREEKRLLGLL